MAICPIKSSVLVIKVGRLPAHVEKQARPAEWPRSSAPAAILPKAPSPATIQMPQVKDKSAVTANKHDRGFKPGLPKRKQRERHAKVARIAKNEGGKIGPQVQT